MLVITITQTGTNTMGGPIVDLTAAVTNKNKVINSVSLKVSVSNEVELFHDVVDLIRNSEV